MARPRRNFKALDSLYARRKVHNDRAIKIFPRHRCWITMHISIFCEKETSRCLQSNQGNSGGNEKVVNNSYRSSVLSLSTMIPWFNDNLTLTLSLTLNLVAYGRRTIVCMTQLQFANCTSCRETDMCLILTSRWERKNGIIKDGKKEARGNWTSIWNNWVYSQLASYNSPNSCN